ncbi:MAG: pilus assembly protein [Candidatus Eremiobacteraeota bacterium]|nr:pilus assembly protein [Candidatus Eremiobacteraeota bacterium]
MMQRLLEKYRRLLRADSGASMVEFAILAPVLILMLIGLIEVGRYTYFAILAGNAARAGVQYGAQSTTYALDNTGMQNAALQDAQNLSQWSATATHFCTLNGASASCPAAGATPPPGMLYYVQVKINGTFQPMMAYPGIPKNVPIGSTATMRVIAQ